MQRILKLLIALSTLLSIILIIENGFGGDLKNVANKTSVIIEWNKDNIAGNITSENGVLGDIEVLKGYGKVGRKKFNLRSENGRIRIKVSLMSASTEIGPNSTMIRIHSDENPFSFLLRDVNKKTPIFIPEFKVIVAPGSSTSSFNDIKRLIESKKLLTEGEKIEKLPEESFASASKSTRNMTAPIWLGTSRDFRIFELSKSLPDSRSTIANLITPMLSASNMKLTELGGNPVNYLYAIGRGEGTRIKKKRHLEEGYLPILHTNLKDGGLSYNTVEFVALERSRLKDQTGTYFLVADSFSHGHMFTKEQKKELDDKVPTQLVLDNSNETVFYLKSVVSNISDVPRYAWFKMPRPGSNWSTLAKYTFNRNMGMGIYDLSGKVFCIGKIDGKPVNNEEEAVLIQPGKSITFEFMIPHSPISIDRASQLAVSDLNQKHDDAREYWLNKLSTVGEIEIPEEPINDMIKAGLLHLDLISYGKEPNGILAPTIGVYSPIGTESSPIIQYYNSIGSTDLAKRSLEYFLYKQHEDGFIQNFGGYMVETGAALWSMGEYYRYTHDSLWVRKNAEKFIKSADFLIRWRKRNMNDKDSMGYGLIEGRVADPADDFKQYMLNAYGYLGMKRIAEVLKACNIDGYKRIENEADAWRKDIRISVSRAMANSPVVPVGDGTWVPTCPPWAEAEGPASLYLKPGTQWTHGTFTAIDNMIGPLYLIFCEVYDPHEEIARFIMKYSSELFLQDNSAFSQPYYSRHDWILARLGKVKQFLNTYYSQVSAHADRETYTFWEHMYRVSPHKTHEEAWFLMNTRWMMYLEESDTLSLFKLIPRNWLSNGKSIRLRNVKSYFGTLNIKTRSDIDKGIILADVNCDFSIPPKTIRLRLPHPDRSIPKKVIGGRYDPSTESVLIEDIEKGQNKWVVRLLF